MKKHFSFFLMVAAIALTSSCHKDDSKVEPQKPEDKTTLEIVTKSVTLAKEAYSTATATVNTNADKLTFDFGAADSWLNASFDGNSTITITALSENSAAEVRTATITVTAAEGVTGTIGVTQAAAEKPDPVVTTVIGDPYQKGDVKGVIFWVDPTNAKNVKIVSLKANGPMNFCTNAEAGGSTVNALSIPGTSATDGAANMTAIANFMSTNSIAESEMLGYATCKAEGDGWYLPSTGELADLVLGYSLGLDFATIEATRATSGDKPSEWVSKLTAAEADPALIAIYKGAYEARVKMDKSLTDMTGDPINAVAEDNSKIADGTTYLGSSQDSDDAKVGYACSGGRPRTSAAAKYAKNPTRYIRCIKAVTLD